MSPLEQTLRSHQHVMGRFRLAACEGGVGIFLNQNLVGIYTEPAELWAAIQHYAEEALKENSTELARFAKRRHVNLSAIPTLELKL